MKRKMLVTSALPYGNGPLHLGHLLEAIQTDIWVRFQKMQGHDVLYVCGDDSHGTPIMIKAEKEGLSPEAMVKNVKADHEATFKQFFIDFDSYHTTHSEENRALAETIYARAKAKGDMAKKEIQQAFDPVKKMFLPDRYIKGECPLCGAPDQYGDNCEVCGGTYLSSEIKNPTSILSGATPITKASHHIFFQLPHYTDMLQTWFEKGPLQAEVKHKLAEWFEAGLKTWDISRDSPYFGFSIPGEKDKYFYVWLDAPIGYIASFDKLQQTRKDLAFAHYWGKDSDSELYHFVGKDIIYFHALFWPALLESADLRLPTAIYAHGFLTVNGEKMSKSRGTFIQGNTFLKHLSPAHLRYYLAAKLSHGIDDIDLNFQDFMQRINADLVGKVVNIASRLGKFMTTYFDNRLAKTMGDPTLYDHFIKAGASIANHFENRDFNKAVRDIMGLADEANQAIAEKAPWQMVKTENGLAAAHQVCTLGLNLFRVIITYLKPILPQLAEQVERFLNSPPLTWENSQAPLLDHRIEPFTPLMQRINENQIAALLEDGNE